MSISLSKRAWARKMLADAAQEKQEGMQGQCNMSLLFEEVLEQVKRSADTDCGPPDNAPCVQRNEARQLRKLKGGMQERRKAL